MGEGGACLLRRSARVFHRTVCAAQRRSTKEMERDFREVTFAILRVESLECLPGRQMEIEADGGGDARIEDLADQRMAEAPSRPRERSDKDPRGHGRIEALDQRGWRLPFQSRKDFEWELLAQ